MVAPLVLGTEGSASLLSDEIRIHDFAMRGVATRQLDPYLLNITTRRANFERPTILGPVEGAPRHKRRRRHDGPALDLLVIVLDLLIIAAVAAIGIAVGH